MGRYEDEAREEEEQDVGKKGRATLHMAWDTAEWPNDST
jgi:hypothetical protein